MLLLHAYCLAEARSCLAALADLAESTALSAAYERLLIDLDVLTADAGPATFSLDGVTQEDLVQRAEGALNGLTVFGVDSLGVEVLIERLHGLGLGP